MHVYDHVCACSLSAWVSGAVAVAAVADGTRLSSRCHLSRGSGCVCVCEYKWEWGFSRARAVLSLALSLFAKLLW